jgi:hypothetical protein
MKTACWCGAGWRRWRRRTRHGLKALKQIAGVEGLVQTHHVGFRLGRG